MTRSEILKLDGKVIDEKVKIQGTDYDRKRVVTSKVLKKIMKLQGKGKNPTYISNKLGIGIQAIKYNTDREYRERVLAKCSGKHTGVDYITIDNRITYKRNLLLKNKLSLN